MQLSSQSTLWNTVLHLIWRYPWKHIIWWGRNLQWHGWTWGWSDPVSKSEREEQIPHAITDTWSLKKWQKWACLKTKIGTDKERKGGINLEVGINKYTLLCVKLEKGHGNPLQCPSLEDSMAGEPGWLWSTGSQRAGQKLSDRRDNNGEMWSR